MQQNEDNEHSLQGKKQKFPSFVLQTMTYHLKTHSYVLRSLVPSFSSHESEESNFNEYQKRTKHWTMTSPPWPTHQFFLISSWQSIQSSSRSDYCGGSGFTPSNKFGSWYLVNDSKVRVFLFFLLLTKNSIWGQPLGPTADSKIRQYWAPLYLNIRFSSNGASLEPETSVASTLTFFLVQNK